MPSCINQFGFDRLAVQDYARDADEVRVEIYKMNDPAGAAAVFAEITGGMTRQTIYGAACTLDHYQILFQRGAYCVSVTTYEAGARDSGGHGRPGRENGRGPIRA